MTPQELQQAMGCTATIAAQWAQPLTAACKKFDINTPARIAAFIAQIGHESASLLTLSENLNYSAQGLANTWPRRFAVDSSQSPPQPNKEALLIARNPEAIANSVYANRLGNNAAGDGWKYRGRGPIQITGKSNYTDAGKGIGVDLVKNPEKALQPDIGAMIAAWFWSTRGLNSLIDAGQFDKVTRIINGGTNGATDRQTRYDRARKVFK